VTIGHPLTEVAASTPEPLDDDQALAAGVLGLLILASLAIPLALDAIFLPMTIPHDFYVDAEPPRR
jgi:hypothetical protein